MSCQWLRSCSTPRSVSSPHTPSLPLFQLPWHDTHIILVASIKLNAGSSCLLFFFFISVSVMEKGFNWRLKCSHTSSEPLPSDVDTLKTETACKLLVVTPIGIRKRQTETESLTQGCDYRTIYLILQLLHCRMTDSQVTGWLLRCRWRVTFWLK